MMIKLVLLLSALAGLTTATQEASCDECKEAAVAFMDRLLTTDSITEQISVLVTSLCPLAEDPATCEAGLNGNWEAIANILYPVFLEPEEACERADICKPTLTTPAYAREWTCEECTGAVYIFAAFIEEENTIEDAIVLLQGEQFCGNGEHTEDCGQLVAELMPEALPVLAVLFAESAAPLCLEILGVC